MRQLILITSILALIATGVCAQGGDECDVADVISISGFGTYIVAMDNTTATTGVDPLPVIPCDVMGGFWSDIWFAFVPDADGAITATTCDAAGWDTDFALYDGTGGCGTLVEIACNGDGPAPFPPCQNYYSHFPIPIAVTGGNTYYFRIGGWVAASIGTGNLTLDFFSVGSEICDDGADNDADGLIDCADPDCIGVGLCGPEICDDGFDNDGDGLIDCFDVLDCQGTPACPAATNDECVDADDLPIAGPGIYTAFMDSTTASLGADPLPGILCTGMGQFDNDIWFSFTPDINMVAEIHTCDAAGWDSDLIVYEDTTNDCNAMTEIACNGDSTVLVGCQGFYSHVQFVSVSAGTTYRIRIGSYGLGLSGVGTLTVNLQVATAEICDDGIDNDLDGATDCLDSDCFADPICTFTPGDECFVAIDVFDGANPISNLPFTTSTDPPVDISLCPGSGNGAMAFDGWWEYEATETADYWIHTCDPAAVGWNDTDLLVYDFTAAGEDCANLAGNEIACNGDSFILPGPCQNWYSLVELSLVAGNKYMIRIGTYSTFLGTGSVTIQSLTCPPLTGLTVATDCNSGEATLSWDANAYDTIDLMRDGVLIASVPGSDTSYVDPGLADGSYTYEVQGVCAGIFGGSETVVANIATYGGESDVIFGLEGVDQIDSVAALQAALDANGITHVTTTLGPAEWGCFGSGTITRAWMMTGTWPNDYRITDADGAALATAVENGTNVFFEAGDHWGFGHLITAFDNYDGVDQGVPPVDGDDSFLSMNGANSGFGLDTSDLSPTVYNQASAGIDYTDQINPLAGGAGPNAAQIWTDAVQGYGTGVFYATDAPNGNTISQSWEFGGFGGDQIDLAARYITALGGGGPPPGVTFTRGDCNADGGFNIADQIYILAALFSGGPSGICDDACDENDDGSINIADGIFGLTALFNGGPPPPSPSPAAGCGVDATDTDALDCASFPPCP